MARLITTGFDVGIPNSNASFNTGPDGHSTVFGVISSTVTRNSGASSLKCDSGAGNATKSTALWFAGANGTSYFFRVYVYFVTIPTVTSKIIASDNGLVNMFGVKITTAGKLQLFAGGTPVQQGSDSTTVLTTATWYKILLKVNISAGSNDSCELKVNDETVATATGLNVSDNGLNNVNFGVVGAGANIVVYFDDAALNDSTGATENSYPGDVHGVVLLKPTGDNAVGTGWVDGDGAGTLFGSLDNIPPTGAATPANGTQIKNLTSTSTGNYDADCTTYTTAGVPSGATVTVAQAWCIDGEAAAGVKSGALLIVSNPTQSPENTFTYCENAGAYGAWPSNWRCHFGTAQVAPSVTLGTAPVLRVGKRTASVAEVGVCGMGIYAEYTASLAIDGSSSLAITTSGNLTATVPVAGSSSIVVTTSGNLTATVPIAGSSSLAITTSGNLTATVPVAGSSSIVVTTSGNLTATVPITGSSSLAITMSGNLTATVPVAGSSSLAITTSGDLTATVPITGSSSIVVTTSGNLTADVPIAASSSIVVSTNAELSATVPVAGSSSLVVTTDATLVATFPVSGSSSITTTTTAELSADVPITGSSSIVVSTSGTLTTTVPLAGSSTIVVSPSATLSATVPVSGSSAITTSTTAILSATVPIIGSSSLTTTTTAVLSATVIVTGSSSLSTSTIATLRATLPVSGSSSIVFTTSGDLSLSAGIAVSGSSTIILTTYGNVIATRHVSGSASLVTTTTPVIATITSVILYVYRVQARTMSMPVKASVTTIGYEASGTSIGVKAFDASTGRTSILFDGVEAVGFIKDTN